MSDELATKLSKLGLDEAKSKEVSKNKKLAAALSEIADEVPTTHDVTAKTSSLLQQLATKSKDAKPEDKVSRKLVVDAVLGGRLKSNAQVDAAWKYVNGAGAEATAAKLDEEAGVGIEVTDEQVAAAVDKYLSNPANRAELEQKRYKNVPVVLGGVKNLPEMKWANPALFKPLIDAKVLEILGPRDERDTTKQKAKKPEKKSEGEKKEERKTTSVRSMFSEGFLGALHKPGENPQADPLKMVEHLKATGKQVYTRFPPEPNGYLHIGHSKAITVNFGYAKFHNGKCYLRFDDTNPKAEDDVYVQSIKDIVDWLGFEPYKVTYSSDYFNELYALAEKLIGKGLAYVCYCTAEQVKAGRGQSADGTLGGERKACEHRAYPVEKNLEEFRNMRDGKYQPGEITLRMKMDLQNPNPAMWDIVAYRVVNEAHHRTGTTWKIYPTYEFTHCLVDSLENISHSLCTLEFRTAREAYEWLCDAVEVYRPAQREYGRLNVTGTIMSKRKILKLVTEKYVRGWDDPRLYTLVAIRRRGVPPGAVLNFVAELGVTTNHVFIQAKRFDNSVRKYLENTTPRLMMVLDPVLVEVENVDEDFAELVSIPFKPGTPAMGEHELPFTKRFYIDRSDFKSDAPGKDFFRLAPGQPVGLLKVPHNVRYVSHDTDSSSGKVTKIVVHYDNDVPAQKPKTFIQWVPHAPKHGSPVKLSEVRLFEQLFKSDNPESNPGGFLADINDESESVVKDAIIEPGIFEVKKRSPWVAAPEEEGFRGKEVAGSPESIRFQALRVGYFCLDKDSTEDKWVLNRIVTLKEDAAKNS